MKTEELSVQDAIEQGMALPWALVRSLSSVTLGLTPAEVDQEELLEARFFHAEEEIRVFQVDGRLRAARLCAETKDSRIERTYQISNPKFGKRLTVSYELEADEDGQTYLSVARLVGWEAAI